MFSVKSDPLQADIFFLTKSGEKKPLGKTPLEMPVAELRKTIGEEYNSAEFFTVLVEKPGFAPESYSIPVTRFGTMLTALDVKLKASAVEKEAGMAKDILNHFFLAQKLANTQQFERAQIEIDKILALVPTFPRALSMRAAIFYAQKNYADSVKWYDEAIKADPQAEDTIKLAARVRALKEGRDPASSTKDSPASKDKKP